VTLLQILLLFGIVLFVAAVALGVRYAWKRRCPSCGKWLALRQTQREALDGRHQLATQVCTYCGFTRRRIDKDTRRI
jgi:predicted RNA-binding Zn-ribbon protein involved in translation (DUF1610 family)